MHEISLTSDRKTQLIDITDRVRAAVGDATGSAVLVYVPHTTAAVTINEKIDPALVADLERCFEKVVGDDWDWVHDDADGPNGPSHGRASLAGAQVLIPLRDGAPALGRYQAVFLCEFDGPKPRSVYVTVLAIEAAALFGLRLRTPRLELRLPTESELVGFAAVAEAGIHPPQQMPFRVAWTDGAGKPGFVESFVDFQTGLLRDWSPESWMLELSVWSDGEPMGFQSVRADGFPVSRRVETGSWLGARFQRKGYGTEMRTAVLDLAFNGLGALVAGTGYAEDNLQSKGVSAKLGYEPDGEGWESPRGAPIRHLKHALTAARWAETPHPPTEIEGLEPCLPLFGLDP